MAEGPRPLPIWPHDITDEQHEMIRRAKLEVGVDFSVMPAPAVPGSPGRVLAIGAVPPFFCESVLVSPQNVNTYSSILGAMRFWLTAEPGEPGSFVESEWLSYVMGCDVIFVGEEALE
jgi:hypothetical protein